MSLKQIYDPRVSMSNNVMNGLNMNGVVNGQLPASRVPNIGSALEEAMLKGQNKYNDMLDLQIDDLNSTDWLGAGSLGLQGLGTLMQMGLYGGTKDYLQGSVSALEQATQNAEEAHNTKLANNASYGSAFSRNA